MNKPRVRILGFDPGLRHTGWGVLDAEGNHLRFVAAGTIDGPTDAPMPERLLAIHQGLMKVLHAWHPDEVAVEETVVNRNPASSLKLGHARGVAVLSAALAELPVWEYSAKSVKQAVTGTGAAKKEQIALMVQRLLPGATVNSTDASDALAVAICHVNNRQFDRLARANPAKAAGR